MIQKYTKDEIETIHPKADHMITILSIGDFQFLSPMPFKVTYMDWNEMYYLENEELELYSLGSSIHDAMRDLAVEIRVLWENYAIEDDSKLTADAQILKRKVLNSIIKHK